MCLDLHKFVKRSSGIFGATGTGKSFLTRMVLAGLMKEDVAAALVFDMHNEYAFDDSDTDRDVRVRGLKSLFGQKVQVAALGAGAQVRGHTPDFTLELAHADFRTSDILLLSDALNLTDTAAVTLNALERAFGRTWFADFMKLEPGAVDVDPESGKTFPADNSVAAWARQNNIHEKAAEALHRKLQLIYDRAYVTANPAGDPVKAIIDKLENGRSCHPRLWGIRQRPGLPARLQHPHTPHPPALGQENGRSQDDGAGRPPAAAHRHRRSAQIAQPAACQPDRFGIIARGIT
ncbi:MAG: ATP-binding protein [Chloroflexi bacterium]|nr:ATP-binding protein [Chloroflexota bacterium]